jgi:hypothetical protein
MDDLLDIIKLGVGAFLLTTGAILLLSYGVWLGRITGLLNGG